MRSEMAETTHLSERAILNSREAFASPLVRPRIGRRHRSPVGRRSYRRGRSASWRAQPDPPSVAELGPDLGIGQGDPEVHSGFDDFARSVSVIILFYTNEKYTASNHQMLLA